MYGGANKKEEINNVGVLFLLTHEGPQEPVMKAGHINIKTKTFDFEARDLICWLVNALAIQPIRMRASKSNIYVFRLRWSAFLTASIVI